MQIINIRRILVNPLSLLSASRAATERLLNVGYGGAMEGPAAEESKTDSPRTPCAPQLRCGAHRGPSWSRLAHHPQMEVAPIRPVLLDIKVCSGYIQGTLKVGMTEHGGA